MKNGKAPGPSDVKVEILKAAGDDWLVLQQKSSSILVIYLITEKKALFSTCTKVKEFPSNRGNYRGLKLTDQVLKVEEHVLETKCVIILNMVCID